MKNNFSFSESELTQAAGILNQAMLQAVAELETCTPCFSAEFEAKMSHLCKKQKHLSHTKKIFRSICTVAASFLIVVGIWIATDSDARAGLLNWIQAIYKNRILYEFISKPSEPELPLYTPTWIPDGFVEISCFSNKKSRTTIYENKKTGENITFHYFINEDGRQSEVFNFSEAETVCINGNTGEYVYGTDTSKSNDLIWIDKNENLVFYISSNLSKFYIIRIASSVKLEYFTK